MNLLKLNGKLSEMQFWKHVEMARMSFASKSGRIALLSLLIDFSSAVRESGQQSNLILIVQGKANI